MTLSFQAKLRQGFADTAAVLATHRICGPAETVARLRPLFPQFGITRVANLTGLDRIGLPVVMVCRPTARSSAVFHGKGVDLETAKASGLMEAAETWHAEEAQPDLRYGSVDSLASTIRLVDLDGLPRNPGPAPTARDRLLWAEGVDLFARAPTWVPFEMVHASSALDGPPSSGRFAMNTNGLASGNHLLEAISHGLCEVIERDATTLWRTAPRARQDDRRIDLATVEDPACRQVLDMLAEARLDVAVWDVTTDIGIPVYKCLLKDPRTDLGHIGSGAGCHLAARIALLRALTEAAQTRMSYIVGAREDILPDDYRESTLLGRNHAARLVMGLTPGQRAFEATPEPSARTLGGDVERLLERLAGAGMGEAVAVDLAQPGFDIAVVRVIVPHLEGSDHHGGYVPGRRGRRGAMR